MRHLQLGQLHLVTLLAANSFVAIFIGVLAIGELDWTSAENSLRFETLRFVATFVAIKKGLFIFGRIVLLTW